MFELGDTTIEYVGRDGSGCMQMRFTLIPTIVNDVFFLVNNKGEGM